MAKSKKAIFLGGSYAQLPILKEAKNRGWYVIVCDYLKDNPGQKLADEFYNISTTDFDAVLNLTKKIKPDFVIAYASDPAAPTAAYVSEKLGLPGNSYKSVQLLSEKDLFRQFLAENGFNTPKAISVKTPSDIEKVQNLQFPVVIKPTDSSGSKGVKKIETLHKIQEGIDYALKFSRNNRIIVEEFIEGYGPQLHGDGFVIDGKLVFKYLGDHHYNKSVNPFVPFSTTWPSIKSKAILQNIEKELQNLISLSGFRNGAINIEIRTDRKGHVYIMEVGPRSGGNFVPKIMEYAAGFDMIKATLDLYDKTPIHPDEIEKKNAAYYVVHSAKQGILKELEIKDGLKGFVKEFHQYIRRGEKVNSFQGANAAIGVVLLEFESKEEMDYYIRNMGEFIVLQVVDEKEFEI